MARSVNPGTFLKATRNQARQMVGQASARLQGELDRLDQRSKAADARLNKVESRQRQDRAQLAEIDNQLRAQVANLHEQLTAAQENTGRDLANMQEKVSNNEGSLHTLAQQLHRDRVTFEIVKNSPPNWPRGLH